MKHGTDITYMQKIEYTKQKIATELEQLEPAKF